PRPCQPVHCWRDGLPDSGHAPSDADYCCAGAARGARNPAELCGVVSVPVSLMNKVAVRTGVFRSHLVGRAVACDVGVPFRRRPSIKPTGPTRRARDGYRSTAFSTNDTVTDGKHLMDWIPAPCGSGN